MKKHGAIAFIPARKNSKRLPGKNKRLLHGVPLFQYTVVAALDSNCYEKVVLTTDDEEIIELGSKIHGLTVIRRPEALARDDVRAKDVVLHHLGEMAEDFEYVSLLMATSPFRDAGDIQRSFALLREQGGDSLASVVAYEFHPALALKIRDGQLYSYFDLEINWVREGEFEKAYHFNGAIFTAKTEFLLAAGTFVHTGTIAYPMDRLKSMDIDTELDFRSAELILGEPRP
ncbi:MAG: acylneuraminate cytidylyltransferase family protein [Candidatus Margulisiibacteriota bacterium]